MNPVLEAIEKHGKSEWYAQLLALSLDQNETVDLAIQAADAAFSEMPAPLDAEFAVRHAPEGGVVIAGQRYEGGQFIPDEAWTKASDEERTAVVNEALDVEIGDKFYSDIYKLEGTVKKYLMGDKNKPLLETEGGEFVLEGKQLERWKKLGKKPAETAPAPAEKPAQQPQSPLRDAPKRPELPPEQKVAGALVTATQFDHYGSSDRDRIAKNWETFHLLKKQVPNLTPDSYREYMNFLLAKNAIEGKVLNEQRDLDESYKLLKFGPMNELGQRRFDLWQIKDRDVMLAATKEFIAMRKKANAAMEGGFAIESKDAENPAAQAIIKKVLGASSKLAAQGKRELRDALKGEDQSLIAERIVKFVEQYRLQLANLLSGTQLASFLEGMREVARKLPGGSLPPHAGVMPMPPPSLSFQEAQDLLSKMRGLEGQERAQAIYQLTPDKQEFVIRGLAAEAALPPGPPAFKDARPPKDAAEHVVYPTIDEAVKELASKNVVTRNEFDSMDAASRAKAFTVAGVDAQETLAKIRDTLAEEMAKGIDVADAKEAIIDAVGEGTFLSEGHLENVIRTNVQAAFSDGQMKVVSHPFVKSGFPYATIDPIDDDRVEDIHLAMATRGIQGTNVYLTSDPVFQTFRPPWRWS
jgi:hypothetical protein